MKTKVIFLWETEGEGMTLLAFFPEKLRQKPKGLYDCYSRVGQHSTCTLEYAQGLHLVDHTNPRVFSLVKELESEGYDLDIVVDWESTIHVEYLKSNTELNFKVETRFTKQRGNVFTPTIVSRNFETVKEAEAYILGIADLDGNYEYTILEKL